MHVRALLARFGASRVFRVAFEAEETRRRAWLRRVCEHLHDNGRTGIFRHEAMRQSRRMNHAHNIANDIYQAYARVRRELAELERKENV